MKGFSLNYKLFSKSFICSLLFIVLLIIATNYIVNPLYTWNHNYLNIKKKDFNERIQKTNYLKYINNDFDAILLGNSRTTYINQNDFDIGYKVFNYAVNAMSVYEYDQVIKNFIKLTGNEPKVILLALEPFSFKGRPVSDTKEALSNTEDLFYRFKNLVSFDLFRTSIGNITTTIKFENKLYDRKQRFYDGNLIKGIQHKNSISNEKYISVSENTKIKFDYDSDLIGLYKDLIKKYPDSKFIVFTLPIHNILLKEESNNKIFNKIENVFLTDIVNTFGEVYHFMYYNEVTSGYLNFFDPYHFYPHIGKMIAQSISKNDNKSGFGIKLNKSNLHNYLNKGKNNAI